MINVVESERSGRFLHITIEDPEMTKLTDPGVLKEVADHASETLPGAVLVSEEPPYPVDEEGKTTPELVMGKLGKAFAFRKKFKLTSR